MKHKMKLLAAALAVVAAAPAGAAILDGTTGNGELFLSAWDPSAGTAGTSYTLDLNITESAFTGTSNLSFAHDSNMTSFLSQVTPGSVQWNVVAMDSTGDFTTAGDLNYYTTGMAVPTANQVVNNRLLNSVIMNVYLGAVNNLIGGGNSIMEVSTGPLDDAYAGNGTFGPDFGGKIAYNTVGALNQNLNFYNFSSVDGIGADNAAVATFAGQWKLASTGDLTYTIPTVSEVPVPAAAWLFASGLMGLVGVSRRKHNIA